MKMPVELTRLQRRMGKVTVIKDINAQVLPGQVIALLGKNGAGKTTLLETLLGFGVPTMGSAQLWGEEAYRIDGALKQRIGFVPQQDELINSLTGKEHLALFNNYRQHWNQALVDRLIAEWLIPMDSYVGKLSLGQRQKLSILLALAHEPELLVLDEPVASLDPIARRQFLQQLVEIAADERRAVIFSTHLVGDVERVANQVWIMRAGELAYQGELDELKESFTRVHIHATEAISGQKNWPGLLHQKIQGKQAQLVFSHWQPALERELANHYGAQVDVERLGLEDIFLELNP